MSKQYAILIKPKINNDKDFGYDYIDTSVCDLTETKNKLKWYHNALKCENINYCVRSINGRYYMFVFDDDFLNKNDKRIIMVQYDKQELICGRVVMLPFIKNSDDFIYFNDDTIKQAIEDLRYCQVQSVALTKEDKYYNAIMYDF